MIKMTRKQIRKAKRIIKGVFTIAMVVATLVVINTIKININDYKQQEINEIKEYQQCIYNQHKEQSYIIRSSCSSNWKTLDKKANIEYKQVKMDLYLVSIDDLEM